MIFLQPPARPPALTVPVVYRKIEPGPVRQITVPASAQEEKVVGLLLVFVQQVVLDGPGDGPSTVQQFGAALRVINIMNIMNIMNISQPECLT